MLIPLGSFPPARQASNATLDQGYHYIHEAYYHHYGGRVRSLFSAPLSQGSMHLAFLLVILFPFLSVFFLYYPLCELAYGARDDVCLRDVALVGIYHYSYRLLGRPCSKLPACDVYFTYSLCPASSALLLPLVYQGIGPVVLQAPSYFDTACISTPRLRNAILVTRWGRKGVQWPLSRQTASQPKVVTRVP